MNSTTETPVRYMPTHFMPLLEPRPERRKKFYALYGGRSGGKSRAAGLALLIRAREIERMHNRPARIMCARESMASIRQSSKAVIEGALDILGWRPYFEVQNNRVITPLGGEIFFVGISETYRTDEAILSIEGVDLVWFEQSESMSERTHELLYPTIFRTPGAEIWLTFNPRFRHDPVYRDFVIGLRSDEACIMKGNYGDMPAQWRTDAQEAERLACLRDEPDRYPHIWLGEPDDVGGVRLVLPYATLRACVDMAHLAPDNPGPLHLGLDIADTGSDRNALVGRRGPLIVSAERWSAKTLGDTTRRAHTIASESGAVALHYDVGGVGAGVRSHLADMDTDARTYATRPVNFGAAVEGKDVSYTRGVSNADFFARRSSQLAWALRLRAQNTVRLRDGEAVDPARCLFVSPDIPRLEEYLAQLAQPQWDENPSGKLTIDKSPDDAPSPDLYDATALAFARDSRSGLRAR